MSDKGTGFLDMFPGCDGLSGMCGGLEKALVTSAVVEKKLMRMELAVSFPRMPAPAEKSALESAIAAQYGLSAVDITSEYPKPKSERREAEDGGRILMGKPGKGKILQMSELRPDSGSVVVKGEVFAVKNREIPRRGAAVFCFDMTDYSGSVRVSKFIAPGEDRAVMDKIKEGQLLTVYGSIAFNKFEEDMVIEPRAIVLGKAEIRPDTSEKKRVELHLHTRYSALDAITDPAKYVERAALWGHRAIAVTDHGVAQAFPDMWKAGKKYGVKVIYGIEAYYVNDIDEKRAVRGASDLSLDSEFVAFDVETTGLNAQTDRLTEIGAVIFRGGELKETFQTFVNPNMPIPKEIIELTGITDRDVFDAPEEESAMRAFLDFIGDRPIIAHNASFDTGFMAAACERSGIAFDPVSVDTLYMSQCLLPQLKRHKLDIVSKNLGLPDFNHHRATDDAAVVARMMDKFIPMLRSRGADKLSDIDSVLVDVKSAENRRARHLTILVRNKVGLKNLYKLISASYLEHYQRNPIIPRSLLMQHREGLLIGSACEAGELYSAVLRGAAPAELRRIASFYDYIEIMPLYNNRFLVENGVVRDEEALRDLNRRVARLAAESEKLLVATGDVHFLDAKDEVYRKILLAAKKFADADKDLPIYFRTTDEMLEEFAYLDKRTAYEAVIKNPNRIADMCEEIELLPKELFPPKIENSDGQLKDLVYGRLRELYGDTPPKVVTDRVETELNDILSRHYDVIYMSAQKLVADSNAHGYLVGSRGSVGSSLVAYLSGITEVNSLTPHYLCPKCKYADFDSGAGFGCGADMPDMLCPVCGEKMHKEGFNIPFETFLGVGGDKVPDIDLNFSGEYQAKAHKYTEELFGADHVFKAGTIGTLADKTAFGYVMKYLDERGLEKSSAEKSRLALGLVGVKRTTGQHPGGLVVIPQDMEVEDFCPVQHPADDPGSGIITTHFEYHCMESNLLKLDELGHDDPTMLKMLGDMTGVDVRAITFDDPETMLLFKSTAPLKIAEDDPIIGKTGTIGIPEFGTPFTRQMLVDTQPTEFSTLVRLSGYSHGTDVWLGNAKDLILERKIPVNDTIGCRDDIMLYLMKMGMGDNAAFKIMEVVRKKNKNPSPEQEKAMRDLGVPDWYIDSCKKIQYLFPKAHAVAYVMMAFRIAWFKVHEPLAFYSAYFYRRSQKDSFDAGMMTKGADFVRRKINEIDKKPDMTAKEEDLRTTLEAVYEFYLRGFEFAPMTLNDCDTTKFIPVGKNALRPPFVAIAGLGATAAADLIACRDSGHSFVSVEELSAACPKVSQTHLEQLKSIGALGDLPDASQMSLF
ncbi:MAG: PolC-type DNA polymerase III [Oscillospiraceae bacterium]